MTLKTTLILERVVEYDSLIRSKVNYTLKYCFLKIQLKRDFQHWILGSSQIAINSNTCSTTQSFIETSTLPVDI